MEFCSRSNMIPICVISDSAPENLTIFDLWIWTSGFFFFFWRCVLKLLLGVASALYTAVDNGLMQDFARPAWEHKFIVSLGGVHLFWFESCSVNFSWFVFRSSISTIKRWPVQLLSAFEAYPTNIPRRTFVTNWCTCFDDVGKNYTSAPNGMVGPSNGQLNRPSKGVWPSASKSCTFRR